MFLFSKNDRACVAGARELENQFDTSGLDDQVEMEDVQVEVKPMEMRMMVQQYPGAVKVSSGAGLLKGAGWKSLLWSQADHRPGLSLNDEGPR